MTAIAPDATYITPNYQHQDGKQWVIGAGGTLDVLAGGAIRQMGGGAVDDTGLMRGTGNLSIQVAAAGNANAADTTDDVLFAFTLPAGIMDVAGRQAIITAIGKTAANGNNKQIKIWWGCTAAVVGSAVTGGTVVATSGTVTTNNGGWNASATVTKYGAAASNTQIGQGQVTSGTTVGGPNAPVALTATESGAIIVAVTGASGTTGAASDVLGMMFDVSFAN